MQSEARTCQNCKAQFTIEPEDFLFYEKMNVPAPTFCPACRQVRRMTFRNERSLYSRACDLCKKQIIAVYPKDAPHPVYCQTCWWSDNWSTETYARDFDPTIPFFEQLKTLTHTVPRPGNDNMSDARMINSPYTNCAGDMKNCYLVFGAVRDEDCYYAHYMNDSKDCVDILYGIKNESCYECFDIEDCYNLAFSQSSQKCSDSYFLFDCRNCSDCIGCSGLRNKSFCIFNEQLTAEEYKKRKAALGLDSYQGIAALKNAFMGGVYQRVPRKYYHGQMNEQFSGDYIANVEHSLQSFYTKKIRNGKFIFWCNNALDVYDYFAWGDIEHSYECTSCGEKTYNCRFCAQCWSNDTNLEYCTLCFTSSDLFGCVGLRQKQFYILNRKYSEQEYRTLRGRIIEQMNAEPYKTKTGIEYRYGEFFPPELSPYAYNDSVAQEHAPLPRASAEARALRWSDETLRERPKATLSWRDLPDTAAGADDTIIKQIITCQSWEENPEKAAAHNCTGVFRIISQELAFYKKKGFPLPRFCPNSRHFNRVQLRNPLCLWSRKCNCAGAQSENNAYKNTVTHAHGTAPCSTTFETAYSPDRPDIVYCEPCYQAEVV